MFPMTISIHTPEQLKAVMNVLHDAQFRVVQDKVQPADEAPAPEVAAPAGKPTHAGATPVKTAPGRRTAEAAAATAAPAPSTKPSAPPPPTAPAAPASSAADEAPEPVSYAQVADAVLALIKARGRGAAVAVLQAQGVARAPDLKPEQYREALDALTEALTAQTEEA